jgi:putative ABC transport system permease protein
MFAVALVQISLPGFNAITGERFVQPLASITTWLILIGTLMICFFVNGIYPAVLLSAIKPLNIFRGKNVLSINDAGLRRALVVLQFAISVTLIIGTMVIYRQLNFMENVDLGYDKAHVFEITIPFKVLGMDDKKRAATLSSIENELKQQSAISDVSLSNAETFYDNQQQSSGSFDWDGRPKDFNPGMCVLSIDDNFAKMMKLKIKEGRWFRPARADVHNVILNETAVKQLNLKEPIIGKVFRAQGDTGVIIGIARDFHYRNLHEKIGPMIINNHVDWASTFYLKTTPGNTSAAILAANGVWKQFDDNDPFDFNFLDEGYNKLYQAEQRSSLLIAIFAGIAILVSGMGLLGLVTFAAEQRVKEIGIRKVLGASIKHIVALLSADFLKLVVIASLVAFPVAWWAMNKWLQDFAYKVDISWWIFMLAAFLALFIALITVSIQGIKAATANPVKSLRRE